MRKIRLPSHCERPLSASQELPPVLLCRTLCSFRFCFHLCFTTINPPQGPHSHILMTGRGGVRVFFWGLKFWPEVIFLGL